MTGKSKYGNENQQFEKLIPIFNYNKKNKIKWVTCVRAYL